MILWKSKTSLKCGIFRRAVTKYTLPGAYHISRNVYKGGTTKRSNPVVTKLMVDSPPATSRLETFRKMIKFFEQSERGCAREHFIGTKHIHSHLRATCIVAAKN